MAPPGDASLRDSECPGLWFDGCQDATRRLVGTTGDKVKAINAVLQPRRTVMLCTLPSGTGSSLHNRSRMTFDVALGSQMTDHIVRNRLLEQRIGQEDHLQVCS